MYLLATQQSRTKSDRIIFAAGRDLGSASGKTSANRADRWAQSAEISSRRRLIELIPNTGVGLVVVRTQ